MSGNAAEAAVFGDPVDDGALAQLARCLEDPRAVAGALMADHHRGYSMPIGGVVAYERAVSPTGVGFDIGCGNRAVLTDLQAADLGESLARLMQEIQRVVSFGIGRSNPDPVEHELFDEAVWTEIERRFGAELKEKARAQLGTIGSGNHYVDLLADESDRVWVANHFGSRGFGHTLASGFLAAAQDMPFTVRVPESEDPVVLDTGSELGAFYVAAMRLAGRYAYAGREYVCEQVLDVLGAQEQAVVENHHNYAWLEGGCWVVRKGATPLTTEPAYIGGSMGEGAVIVRGRTGVGLGTIVTSRLAADPLGLGEGARLDANGVLDVGALGSAPHGAGRLMSRAAAAGKMRKVWLCPGCKLTFRRHDENGRLVDPVCPECGGTSTRTIRARDRSTAAIDWPSARAELAARGIVVLGADADEAPAAYKPLESVLACHPNVEIVHRLRPLGVVMAGPDERDPYKD